MTDKEIIQGLIARDNRVTEEFFFVKCRPLFCSVMKKVFSYEVDYEEIINELYIYLMEKDAEKLRNFQYRSTVYQWLKVLSIRFFIKKRAKMIDDASQETPYNMTTAESSNSQDVSVEGDIERLFDSMPNKRYVYVIRRLVLEGWKPENLAQEMNVTPANLYNIKWRAMAQLTKVALKDVKEYGK